MLPNGRGLPAQAPHFESHSLQSTHELEMQSCLEEREVQQERLLTLEPLSESRRSGDKITCLDGLRGIACLIVFNYHFLWPWTAHIMLGYGALPPKSPQFYSGWPFLPIICLLHRGRPMVAIFFAISGYVLCRHILKAIRERRIDTVYKSLASAVFRRAFRLYIPPILSMFVVAVLAQIGAFRSEKDIFTGPDSKYINGTLTNGYAGRPCTNITTNFTTIVEMADYLNISSTTYLVNVTGNSTSNWSKNNFCLNATSQLIGPLSLYNSMNSTEQVWWKVAMGMWVSGSEARRMLEHEMSIKIQAEKAHNKTMKDKVPVGGPMEDLVAPGQLFIPQYDNWQWIQLGGSWEEHPVIHDKISYALGNLTTVYMEWGNPFNFGHYHTRYDPHTFTIPMELRGSILIYVFLLGTAALKAKFRLGIGVLLVVYSLRMGRWDMALFLGAMLQSEMDIRQASWAEIFASESISRSVSLWHSEFGKKAVHLSCTVIALYFLSYPDAGAEFTPGFMLLSEMAPRYYHPLFRWMFYQAIGALMLLPCILRSPLLRGLLEKPIPQYLGNISFSFYLVHGPVLHSLGFWLMPRLFDRFGWLPGLTIGYAVLLGVALYLADWWHRKIDVWSMTVGRRVEILFAG